jgi:plastocyanin
MMRPALALLCVALGSCGGSTPPSGPEPPPSGPSITISSSGVVTPKELTVSPGARVLFTNRDARRHDVTSDPHPEHTNCPEINQVGLLSTGQTRETGNLVVVRVCGFHDHENPDDANLQGRIVVR